MDAGLSLVSMVPYLGDAVGKSIKAARNAKQVEHLLQRIEALTQQIHKLDPTLKHKASEAMGEGLEAVEKVLDRPHGQYTKLSQPGGLKATEGRQIFNSKGKLDAPSHPLKEHGPDKPLAEVEQRVIDGKQVATKFIDRIKMEPAIGEAIEAKKDEIVVWLSTSPKAGKTQAFDCAPGLGNLGKGYHRTSSNIVEVIPYSLSNVRIIIKADGHGGYVIQSAFPIP
ncbi:RNase A-like domain-containing protein [Anthocerotibacter panamensis]|uniref:RNase A-like domain-containing protein n=1 Tax=Anthocerotibacter panamensis TaxID=2857077 RepID=UPI001C404D9F|nr:RNase A-like domain-containing protein [Anthocerotibacter panamensis]